MRTKTKTKMTRLPALEEAAECLRTIAHPHRLRMIEMLSQGDFTVGELAEACEIRSNMASEHLSLMRDRGLLESRREGRKIYYSIAESGLESIMKCLQVRYGRKRTG